MCSIKITCTEGTNSTIALHIGVEDKSIFFDKWAYNEALWASGGACTITKEDVLLLLGGGLDARVGKKYVNLLGSNSSLIYKNLIVFFQNQGRRDFVEELVLM